MINTLKRATKLAPWLSVAAILATAAPALAQAPSQAQRDAIKSQCRSDYMAHCSSVPPGGEASLQCLQKNMSSLSSSCQSAVRAVEAPAARDGQAGRHRGAESRSARGCNDRGAQSRRAKGCSRSRRAGQPTSAQISAIRSACRSDYPKVCAGVPTGGAPALQCLEKNKAKLSAGCEKAVSAAGGGGATAAAPAAGAAPAAAGAAAAAAPAAPTVIVLRPMRPREELFVLRSACGADVRSICGGVAPAAAGSCSALRPMPRSFRRPARTCCRQFAAR